MAEEMRRGH